MGKNAKAPKGPPGRGQEILRKTLRIAMDSHVKLAEKPSETAKVLKLAEMSGVSRNTIKRILAGTNETTIDKLEKLARALGCSMADLLVDPDYRSYSPPGQDAYTSRDLSARQVENGERRKRPPQK